MAESTALYPITDDERRNELNSGSGVELSHRGAAGAYLAWAVPAETQPLLNGTADSVAPVAKSGDQRIDGLLSGGKWADGAITYSDPDSPGDYQPGYDSDANENGVSAQNENFAQLTAQQLAAAHFALSDTISSPLPGAPGFSVEGFTGLSVDYAGTGVGAATLRLANSSDWTTAYAYLPFDNSTGGDAWFGPEARAPIAGNWAWHTALHELGHTLGLKHGHESGAGPFGPMFGPLPAAFDSMEFSVMTYRSYVGASPLIGYTNGTFDYAQTYMMLDIAALQYLYGADYTVNSTDTVYTWNPSTGDTLVNGNIAIDPGANRIFETIWDGGGIDTYDLSNYTSNLEIDLAPGGYSVLSRTQLATLNVFTNIVARGNVFNALMANGDARSIIENTIGGSGADVLKGNTVANVLRGNAGNDMLLGGDGDDTLDGGTGQDRLSGEAGNDALMYDPADFTINGGPGADVLRVAGSAVTIDLTGIPDNLIADIEAIDLTGSGNNRLVLRASDALALSSTTDVLRVDGNTGDQLTVVDAPSWSRGADQRIGTNLYSLYIQGSATLLIDSDITTNLGGSTSPFTQWRDVNGDGKRDILWRGPNGETSVWLMDGANIVNGSGLGVPPLTWNIVDGEGDYNGDGKSDLLWRGPNGDIVLWLLNGTSVAQNAALPVLIPRNWTIVDGHGDYNADGKSDLLWRGPNGETSVWLMDGANIATGNGLGTISPGWNIVSGHSDFNGDGRSDIVWRGPNGETSVWLMQGANISVGRGLGSPPLVWNLVDAQGDYNADGKSDLLWRGPNGDIVVWLLDGLDVAQNAALPVLIPRNWTIADGHGDYNGDGKSDILWRGPNGETSVWLMDGANISVGSGLGAPPLTWSIVDGHGDYNGDGKSDILWRGANGDTVLWLLDGINVTQNAALPLVTPLDWSITGERGAASGPVSDDADGIGPAAAVAFAALFGHPSLSANDVNVIAG